MTRLPLHIAALTAVSILALAAPAAAEAAVSEAESAAAPAAATARSVAVEGGRIHYQVLGDLNAGHTPVLVLHGAFMSADAMKPLTDRFAPSRPLIVVDQRNHGRTGDVSGPFNYARLADDAAAVLADAGVGKADVVGYSMGGGAALQLALRHPERVDHLVAISISANDTPPREDRIQLTPELFAGSPIESEYKRLSPTPDAFPSLVRKVNEMSAAGQIWPEDEIRALKSPTFVIVGDYDVIRTEHAVELYRLRGGGDEALASQAFLTSPPPARLAILPAASHIGVLGDPAGLSAMILAFLNDETPPAPPGFF